MSIALAIKEVDAVNFNLGAVTAIIKSKSDVFGSVLMSVEGSLAVEIVRHFLDAFGLDDDCMVEVGDAVGETLNVLVGNSLVLIDDSIKGASFSVPQIVADEEFRANVGAQILVCNVETEFGLCSLAYWE